MLRLEDPDPAGTAAREPPKDPKAASGPEHSGGGTWVLQSDAATRTGFSVSAVRKWRRLGLVGDRKVATAKGFERVEVRLEDVLARAALQPDRRQPEDEDGTPPPPEVAPGTVSIALEDLESLFERMVDAEHRAGRLEAELQSAKAQARYTFGQLAELRRQLDARPRPQPEVETNSRGGPASARPAAGPCRPAEAVRGPVPSSPPPVETAPPGRPVPPPVPVTSVAPSNPRPAAERSPSVDRPPERSGPSALDEALEELRAAYLRLDEYRREQTISPARERRRQRDLVDYDAALLTVCSLTGISHSASAIRAISADERSRLTKALARVGLDVRTSPPRS